VCEGVEYRSATFDPFLDLSLEITKANTLTRALQHFTAEEVLDGDNRYRCPKNNKLVSVGTISSRGGILEQLFDCVKSVLQVCAQDRGCSV
jgi:hypothetical protein